MTAEEMQSATKKIMSKFYQFKHMFLLGWNIFSFPSLIFFLYDLEAGWRRWKRNWRNNLLRFGGWLTIKKWTSEFRKDNFGQKLQMARKHLHRLGN
jgi:hypothetical protein